MENEIIKNDKSYPPASSCGGDNAYHLRGCDVVQRSPSYASCLYKINEIEAGRVDTLHQECAQGLASGRCNASAMRQQEQLAGVALFYFPRVKQVHLPVSVSGDFGVLVTNLTDPALLQKMPNSTPSSKFIAASAKQTETTAAAPPVKKAVKSNSLLDNIDTGSYADAINAAPAPAAKKTIGKEDLAKLAKPGESLIDVAKRLLNKVKEAA